MAQVMGRLQPQGSARWPRPLLQHPNALPLDARPVLVPGMGCFRSWRGCACPDRMAASTTMMATRCFIQARPPHQAAFGRLMGDLVGEQVRRVIFPVNSSLC